MELPEVVDSVYFGGGTPSLLSAEQMRRVFAALRGEFAVSADAEITLECAPGQLSDGSLAEEELLIIAGAAVEDDVVEAADLSTGVVEATTVGEAFVSFLSVLLSWAFLSDDGPLRALAGRGASIAPTATQTQSHLFILDPLYGWRTAACNPCRACWSYYCETSSRATPGGKTQVFASQEQMPPKPRRL